MAKKTTRTKTTKKTAKKAGSRRGKGLGYKPGDAKGKHLVIVESPSKARTINKYLGSGYVVLASVGHVRDLPSKAKKGEKKQPVPGVDIEHRFKPEYEVLSGKEGVIRDLKRAAKEADDVWFATDLDREGEAIAWHLAEEIGVGAAEAKRVIFPAITRSEIDRAFRNPHPIDIDRVNAQQARRILDRIVGYQVSPLLWKKVARGLSAGRVQSVAVRLVVDREREIRAFVPDEGWSIAANFALSADEAKKLGPAWGSLLAERDEKGNAPTAKQRNAWLAEHKAIRGELVQIGGEEFKPVQLGGDGSGFDSEGAPTRAGDARTAAEAAGLVNIRESAEEDERGKGPARWKRTIEGDADHSVPYRVGGIETKRTTSRPGAPYITSTMQQAASSRLGFGAQRTMRAAQALYEGVEIPGEGPIGLITYMRTDSTHLSNEALSMARDYIEREFGADYLPDKSNVYTSSNKDAQEAHEAIRPTNLDLTPQRVKTALTSDQFRLYQIIWERFVSCQMTPAQWDATTVTIEGGADPALPCVFRATGRVLVFDGFYRVSGVPTGDTATLPALGDDQPLSPFTLSVTQKFTSPPPRYTEASLIKTLESEGIGRPSTYASIIQVIQDRRYVEQLERRFWATDLGEVVTDKLIEAFPQIMEVSYTREMEGELDKVEDEHLDWIEMLEEFYTPFSKSLERAHEEMSHAKAETVPAPKEYRCEKCNSDLVYRFGKNGRFLSCSRYPDCDYACPVDREGHPRRAEYVDVACPKTGRPMVRRTGRYGPFLSTPLEDGESQDDGIILNIDKKGYVTAPSQPPVETDLPCPKCGSPLNLRYGVRGPWLGCSAFPKCRGRGKWAELDDATKKHLEAELAANDRAHPIPIIRTLDGRPLTDERGKPLAEAPKVDQLVLDEDPTQVRAAG